MRYRDVEKVILQDGWYEVGKRGSHHQFKHPKKSGKVTIQEHGGKEFDPRMIKKIYQQAGL